MVKNIIPIFDIMKKKLYYTVDVEFHDDNIDLGPTGHKHINVYEVDGGVLCAVVLELDAQLSDISTVVIQEWLDDNGYGDDNFDFDPI